MKYLSVLAICSCIGTAFSQNLSPSSLPSIGTSSTPLNTRVWQFIDQVRRSPQTYQPAIQISQNDTTLVLSSISIDAALSDKSLTPVQRQSLESMKANLEAASQSMLAAPGKPSTTKEADQHSTTLSDDDQRFIRQSEASFAEMQSLGMFKMEKELRIIRFDEPTWRSLKIDAKKAMLTRFGLYYKIKTGSSTFQLRSMTNEDELGGIGITGAYISR